MDLFPYIKPLLFSLSAETAHHAAICTLRAGLYPFPAVKQYAQLKTEVAGITFRNPIGMAAGFDKNAEIINPLHRAGFGFVEVGTVTPRPQAGNPQPRLFRLEKDEAIINRLGFNNKGLSHFTQNLATARSTNIVFGANIGKNKETEDPATDFLICLRSVYGLSSYVTINISSPNTPGLRSIQKAELLDDFVKVIVEEAAALAAVQGKRTPLFLKIAPDVSPEELQDICRIAMVRKLDALIISNTTLSRPESLKSDYKAETGGLSGKPLMQLSTHILRDAYRLTEGKIPLIGVGGVASAADAYAKIRGGASLVQVYSSLIYQGFGLVPRILEDLCRLLERDGLSDIGQAVGKG